MSCNQETSSPPPNQEDDHDDHDFDRLISLVLDDNENEKEIDENEIEEPSCEAIWKILDIEFQPLSQDGTSARNNPSLYARDGTPNPSYDATLRSRTNNLSLLILGDHIHAIFSLAFSNNSNDDGYRDPLSFLNSSAFLNSRMPLLNAFDSFSFLSSLNNGRTPSPEKEGDINILPEEEYPSIQQEQQQQQQQECLSQQRRQQRIFRENSLFTNLVERGDIPISICRLLADVLDASSGRDTTANNINGELLQPLASSSNINPAHPSLTQIIADLEQMSTHPHLFLYDQPAEFFASGALHFGQRCYGRDEETKRVFEISTRLENQKLSAVENSPISLLDGMDIPSSSSSFVASDNNNGGQRVARASNGSSTSESESRAEAVFVSGVAGSGKSNFVQDVERILTANANKSSSPSHPRWMVAKVKFKREMEHNSREIVSSLFEKLVGDIVRMKGSHDESDVDYHRKVVEIMSNNLDYARQMSSLVDFIPSLKELTPSIDKEASSMLAGSEVSLWQLVFLLSKLMGSILSLGRHILVCCDDLQWCNSSMLTLISELIMSIGLHHEERRHFLFMGMYRDDEVLNTADLQQQQKQHPLVGQLAALRKCSLVNVTEMKLSSLPLEEVANMIMMEMRLPMRLVVGLASVVHKKTSGHAIFVAQVLNSLVRDSTIAYSPTKHRFDWDENKIATLRMGDSVASLIVSNLSSLQAEALQSLRVLSCFGVQIPLSMIELLTGSACVPRGGMESYLPGLVEGGVVEMAGPSVLFSHDLIQQHVYENVPVEERRRLHLDIGTYISSQISLDSSLVNAAKSAEAGVLDLNLLDESSSDNVQESPISSPSYQLVAIATNQINVAGPESVSNRTEQIRFAGWNLRAGNDAAQRSNFQAALYFYESGIAFLGGEEKDGLWLEDSHRLCHMLHEGSATAYFAVGDHWNAVKFANLVIGNVPLHESLMVQYHLIRALDNSGRYSDAVTNGLNLLRSLKIDIPSEPTLSAAMRAMADTGRAVSAYTFDQITNTHHIVDEKKRNVLRCTAALLISFFRSAQRYLPFISCALVNYSLENGICEESVSAFMMFGYFKVSLEGKYDEGCYWGSVVFKIVEEAYVQTKTTLNSDMICTMYLNFLYYPFKELAFRLMNLYQRCMALGEIEIGLYSLSFSLNLSYYGGEKLSLILKSMEELIELMVKHIKEGSQIALLNKMLVEDLTGNPAGDFPDFGGVIRDEDSLLIHADARKNLLLMEAIHVKRFNSAFWMGDYTKANKCSEAILALPRVLKIQLVFHTFYTGLIAFEMHRDGGGKEQLAKGKDVLDKMKIWSKCSTSNFDNKLLLLEAECHASMCDIKAAKVAFEASGRSARDHGLIHEQGLACELYGKFLTSIVEADEALRWFKCAHTCYIQWGAAAKAEWLWTEHNLGLLPAAGDDRFLNKHGREW